MLSVTSSAPPRIEKKRTCASVEAQSALGPLLQGHLAGHVGHLSDERIAEVGGPVLRVGLGPLHAPEGDHARGEAVDDGGQDLGRPVLAVVHHLVHRLRQAHAVEHVLRAHGQQRSGSSAMQLSQARRMQGPRNIITGNLSGRLASMLCLHMLRSMHQKLCPSVILRAMQLTAMANAAKNAQ